MGRCCVVLNAPRYEIERQGMAPQRHFTFHVAVLFEMRQHRFTQAAMDGLAQDAQRAAIVQWSVNSEPVSGASSASNPGGAVFTTSPGGESGVPMQPRKPRKGHSTRRRIGTFYTTQVAMRSLMILSGFSPTLIGNSTPLVDRTILLRGMQTSLAHLGQTSSA